MGAYAANVACVAYRLKLKPPGWSIRHRRDRRIASLRKLIAMDLFSRLMRGHSAALLQEETPVRYSDGRRRRSVDANPTMGIPTEAVNASDSGGDDALTDQFDHSPHGDSSREDCEGSVVITSTGEKQ